MALHVKKAYWSKRIQAFTPKSLVVPVTHFFSVNMLSVNPAKNWNEFSLFQSIVNGKLERWPKYRREQREIPHHKILILRESSREVLCHSPLLSLKPRQAAESRVPALWCGDMFVCWDTLITSSQSFLIYVSLSHISVSLLWFNSVTDTGWLELACHTEVVAQDYFSQSTVTHRRFSWKRNNDPNASVRNVITGAVNWFEIWT